MKKLLLLFVISVIAVDGYSQVRKTSYKDFLESSQTQIMSRFEGDENLQNVQKEHNMLRTDGNLDYTTYDWQTNSGARTWTHVWNDGKISFAYTYSSNTSYSDRGTAIGMFNSNTSQWIPFNGRAENEKTGFGSIARYGSNGIVIAAHTASQCKIYVANNKDNINPNSLSAVSALNSTYDPAWPAVMTSGSNRNIIHVIATANAADGSIVSVPGAVGVNQPIIYFRSQNGGQTWDKQNVILPYMGPGYGLDWGANVCYWMETTDDNCLALVVNNAWSDGMVIYSYDNGETWQRKVFWHHPGINTTFNKWFMYPRWTSCQWDNNHHLHVLYEFNGCTGEPGSGSFYPGIGGVAYWNETMPYRGYGVEYGFDPTNPNPPVHGQPFVMDSAYIYQDIYASWWLFPDATHNMWPEYVGYLPALTPEGNPEPDPYNVMEFNIEDRSLHGAYNCGCVAFPVLCKIPGSNGLVAVWSAMDENHIDINGNYYFKLFASCSLDGGNTWSNMVHLTNNTSYNSKECVYNQAAVVGNNLIIATQMDSETGTYVESDDSDPYDNYYRGLTFDLFDLFGINPSQSYTVSVSASPSAGGTVTGGGTYNQGASCTVTATPANGYTFTNWTENGIVVSTQANYTFTVNSNRTLVANFQAQQQNYTITVSANPSNGGTVSGGGTYQQGQSCTVTATPSPGYTFTNWTENGNVVSTNANYTFTVTGNRTLVANFTQQQFTITATADPVNGGSVTGGGTFNYAQSCTLAATPATGYIFINWTKNGQQVSTNATYTFTVIESATYVAHFQLQSFTITVDSNPTEGGNIIGGGTYDYNQNCTVTASANEGYYFINWKENGQVVSTSASYTFTVTCNRSLVAQFTTQPQEYTVSVSASPIAGGTVSGGGTYQQGQQCTVKATANNDYTFANWTENSNVVSSDANYTFTVTGNRNLVANFGTNTYTISVSASPSNGGTVSGGGTYSYGQSCTVTATPNSGYTFTNWTENGNVVSSNANYTFPVNGNRTVVAHFTTQSQGYTVSVSASPSAGGTVLGGGTYQQGQSCTVIAAANSGYYFAYWTENGEQVSTSSSYTFTVNSNRTLVALFNDVSSAYVISASSGPNGSIEPEGDVYVEPGESITFTMIPDNGCVISKVIIDGNDYFSIGSVTFSNVDSNHTIHALFNGVGVEENESPLANISPNPVKGIALVECQGMRRITLYNLSGIVVYDMDTHNDSELIFLDQLSAGMYLMKVMVEGNRYHYSKLIIAE